MGVLDASRVGTLAAPEGRDRHNRKWLHSDTAQNARASAAWRTTSALLCIRGRCSVRTNTAPVKSIQAQKGELRPEAVTLSVLITAAVATKR